jgi:hypothetical protein
MPVTSCGRQDARLLRIDEAVEAVFEANHLNAGVGGRFDDRANDRIQAGSITAAGEDPDFFHSGHQCGTSIGRG